MSQVKIPFQPEFEGRMLGGGKIATSRTKRYGEKGDTFEAFGATFEITNVVRLPLDLIASVYFTKEGFGAPKDFMDVWKRLHPRLLQDYDRRVYLHWFRRV